MCVGLLPTGSLSIRADGYPLLLETTTKLSFKAPLRSLSDIVPGAWIEYRGHQRADGAVRLRSAEFRPDLAPRWEQDLRARSDRDPASVPAGAKQSALSAGWLGIDAAQIPAFSDPAMQARVAGIGERLIPAWERALPASDTGKIDFQFEVTNTKYSGIVLCLPSGNILVPHQIVERLENDDQIAAVLADAMACVLEKQRLRMHMGVRATSDEIAEALLVSAIPGMPIVGFTGAAVMVQKDAEQSARVSLDLMHDAGYDLTQAPRAWWLLASKEPKPLTEIKRPPRTEYLYRTLGTVWHVSATK